MPLLFSLEQREALESVSRILRGGEHVTEPERVGDVYAVLEAALWQHARISIHGGKPQFGMPGE